MSGKVKQSITSDKIKNIIAILILILCEWFFFRNIMGNDCLLGDKGDGRLTNLLTEHWWKFFCGEEKFADVNMFFPYDTDLGFSDMLLGYGPLYSCFRLFGIDIYTAYKLTLMIIQCIGVAATFILLRKELKLNIISSLFGTMAFCFSDSVVRSYNHTQLLAISFIPVLLILWIYFTRDFENRKKRNILAYSFLLCFILLTYTSWYIAFFTGFFCLVFAIVYLIKTKETGVNVWKLIQKWLTVIKWDIIGYIVFTTILFIPFILVYLPVFSASSGYDYSLVAQMMPEPADFINVSEGNLILGDILSDANFNPHSEVKQGFSFVLLMAFIMGYMFLRKKRRISDNVSRKDLLAETACITILVCMLVITKLESNGASLWQLVNILLPFSKSIRAVGRFMVWLTFPMAVAVAFIMNNFLKETKTKIRSAEIICIILVAMLPLSNINKDAVSSQWTAGEQKAFISSVQSPPEEAACFYLLDTSANALPFYIYQIDAAEIAAVYNIPTINGYSGMFPEDWGKLIDIKASDYETGVQEWTEAKGISGVYAYDIAQNSWISLEDRINSLIAPCFHPSQGIMSVNTGLADHHPGAYSWTTKRAEIIIRNPDITDSIRLDLSIPITLHRLQDSDNDSSVSVYVNDELVTIIEASEGMQSHILPVATTADGIYTVRLETEGYFIPNEIGIGEDIRELSFELHYLGQPDV